MLKRSVPPFVAAMREMAELFIAEQPELDRLEDTLQTVLAQFYIKSATYSLERWEAEFGIATDTALTTEQRRARVLAKLSARPPATVAMLEQLVREVMGEDNVRIEEHPEEYYFTVYVQEDKLSDLLWIAKEAMHEIRPAHLAYEFVERLLREARAELYMAGADSRVYTQSGESDTSGLLSPVYAGAYGYISYGYEEAVR